MTVRQPDKHVDHMEPAERYHFRNQQVADLVVMWQHHETNEVVDSIGGFCHRSTQEMLCAAVDQLALLLDASGLIKPVSP